MESNFILDVIRQLLYGLDRTIYELVNILYNLFVYVSNLTLFNSADFEKFSNKIYLILGIVMLFKIAFSLISLFANPDNFTDSNKGVTGIVKRIIVSLVVITFIPTVFQTAYRIQSIILNDNIIGNFLLGGIAKDGTQSDSTISNEIQKNAGKMIAFDVLSAFYYPEPFVFKHDQEGKLSVTDDENGNKSYELNVELSSEACSRNLSNGKVTEDCDGRLYYKIVNETYSIYDYGAFIMKEDNDTGIYAMHYMFLISTVAGIAVAWIFLGFCIDVAVRSVKLSVLQLIAPIPVFSYIDPSKGEKIFKSWYETCISTYLSLFMRLILIYFVIYICYIIGSSGHGILQFDANGVAGTIEGGGPTGIGKCLIYIGLLMFAKDAPELFSQMFGIKMDGASFGTKLAKMGIAGTGLAVGVGGAKYLGNRYRRTLQKSANRKKIAKLNEKESNGGLTKDELEERNDLKIQNKWGTGLKTSFAATRYGMTSGFLGGAKSEKVNMAGLKQGVLKANDTEKIRTDENAPVSFFKQAKETVSSYAGVAGKYGDFNEFKNKIKDLENKQRTYQSQETTLRRNMGNAQAEFAETYKISADNYDSLNEALIKGDMKEIVSLGQKLYTEFDSKLDSAIRNDSVKYAEETKKFTDKFDQIVRASNNVSKMDERNQKAIKEISDYKKKAESVNIK